MPELPEVETVRRGLEPVMTGARVASLELRRADLRFPFPTDFASRVAGATIVALDRRAKYLLVKLSIGETLVMHLGMTGRFTVEWPQAAAKSSQPLASFIYATGTGAGHDHVILTLSTGARVVYNDPRRFGFMLLIADRDLESHPLFRSLGAEPLGEGLTPSGLAQRAVGKKTTLKSFLLDQRVIAGLGNIYVSEALYRARLSPLRSAASISRLDGRPTARADRLVAAIGNVLADAIAAGGSTLRDYRRADGGSGSFQDRFTVYARDGKPCQTAGCNGTIRRIVQHGRSTFYCPRCQR